VRLLEFKAIDNAIKVEYLKEVLESKFGVELSAKDLARL
jgi:hypothetical protein